MAHEVCERFKWALSTCTNILAGAKVYFSRCVTFAKATLKAWRAENGY